jgi:hypothetical protein
MDIIWMIKKIFENKTDGKEMEEGQDSGG